MYTRIYLHMHIVTENTCNFREISNVTEESSSGLGHCGLQCGAGSAGTCRQGSGVFGRNLRTKGPSIVCFGTWQCQREYD